MAVYLGTNKVSAKGGFVANSVVDTSDATATANDIMNGKTAYTASGKTNGTYTPLDTSDATASAGHILYGKTAYANGSKITGTISTKAGSYTIPTGYHSGSGKVSISATEQNKIIASNIKSGVSILGVTGTYTGESSSGSSGNNNCEAYIIDATNPTVSFKSSGTVKVYGYATASVSSGWGGYSTTMYAFAGTSYYKSTVYGSPTSTSLNLSISNGKITGLPTMTGGTLIAVIGV